MLENVRNGTFGWMLAVAILLGSCVTHLTAIEDSVKFLAIQKRAEIQTKEDNERR